MIHAAVTVGVPRLANHFAAFIVKKTRDRLLRPRDRWKSARDRRNQDKNKIGRVLHRMQPGTGEWSLAKLCWLVVNARRHAIDGGGTCDWPQRFAKRRAFAGAEDDREHKSPPWQITLRQGVADVNACK
jgi:hypothetical protein